METTIMPKLVSQLTAKSGNLYWKVQAESGMVYTCHEAGLMPSIKAGVPVSVEWSQSKDGNYNNIHKLGESQSGQASVPVNTPVVMKPKAEPEKKGGSWRSPKEIIACELMQFCEGKPVEQVIENYKKLLAEL